MRALRLETPAARLRVLLLVWSLAAPAAASAALQAPQRGSAAGVDLCRVRGAGGQGAPEQLHVLALPGNRRAVAFGGKASASVETTVACAAPSGETADEGQLGLPPGCAAWPEDRPPVADVAQCPDCGCLQDVVAGFQGASNGLLFELGVRPACEGASAERPVDVLLFGLGGGALHTYALSRCPRGTRVESVEADPRMAAVAAKFFGVAREAGRSVVDTQDALAAAEALVQRLVSAQEGPPLVADGPRMGISFSAARARVVRRAAQTPAMGARPWDVVAVDCFVDKGVTPANCRSKEFVTYLRLLVRRGGTVVHHMWHTSPFDGSVAPAFEATVQLYAEAFGEGSVTVQRVPRPSSAWDSVIVVRA